VKLRMRAAVVPRTTCDQVERMYECERVRDDPQNHGFDNFSP
jgi:hypothetical protein